MRNLLTTSCLLCLELLVTRIDSYGQYAKKVISQAQTSLSQVRLLESYDLANFQRLALSPDSQVGAVYSTQRMLIFKIENKSVLTELEVQDMTALGFLDEETVVVISDTGDKDSIFVYDYRSEVLIHSAEFSIPQTGSTKQLHIVTDSLEYHVSSMTDATTWTFSQIDHHLQNVEYNVIYSDFSGEILRHPYKRGSDTSYAAQRKADNKTFHYNSLIPDFFPGSVSFSPTSRFLLLSDPFSGNSTLPNLYVVDAIGNSKICTTQSESIILFAAFLQDILFATVERTASGLTAICLRTIDGQIRSSMPLTDQRIGGFILSTNRKYLLYQQYPENDIYLVDFSK